MKRWIIAGILCSQFAVSVMPAELPPGSALIENLGQWPEQVKFLSPRGGAAVQLEADAVLLAQHGRAFLRLAFEGAGAETIQGEDAGRCRYAFFLGSNPSRWRSDVRAYGAALYQDVYDGIDLRFHAGHAVEYDLVVHPGADLGQVRVRCDGSFGLRLERDGALVIETVEGPVRQTPPATWQVLPSGARRPVRCEFRLLGGERYGFRAESIDPSLPLVIDPIIEWAVATGGSGGGGPYDDVAFDPTSNFFYAPSEVGALSEFIWTGEVCAQGMGNSALTDAQVAVVDAETGDIVNLIFLGGDGADGASAVVLDGSGALIVGGYTSSSDFPVTNGSALSGAPGDISTLDAIVARLRLPGCGLEFATFLGGARQDAVTAIEVETDRGILACGFTASNDFPTTPGAFQEEIAGGSDVFILRLRPEDGPDLKHQIAYSTFFGGAGDENLPSTFPRLNDRVFIGDMLVDKEGKVIVAGHTRSKDLPSTAGAFQEELSGSSDAFIARFDLNPDLTPEQQLLYSSFLGGSSNDPAPDTVESIDKLAFDPMDGIWVTGETISADFPRTEGAFWMAPSVPQDVFFCHLKLDPTLGKDQLLYAGRVGGNGNDAAAGLAVSPERVVTLGGFVTQSTNLPVTPDAFPSKANQGNYDAYLIQIDTNPAIPSAERLHFAAYIGGSGYDSANGLAATSSGRLICSLVSSSPSIENLDSLNPQGPFFLAFDLRKPKAAFAAVAHARYSLSLDAAASSTPEGTKIVSYSWDLGYGTTAEGAQAGSTYPGPGRYCVSLTVTNDLGLSTTHRECITFPCTDGDTAPWTKTEIAGSAFASSAWLEGEGPDRALHLCAGGRDIASKSDSFFFVHQGAEGDAVITARVGELGRGDEWTQVNHGAKLGLMFREGLEPGARHASIVIQRENAGYSLRWIVRKAVGGSASSLKLADLPGPTGAWLRLERRGADVAAFTSSEGTNWTPQAQAKWSLEPPLSPVLAGVAAVGRDTDPEASYAALLGIVDHLSLEPLAPPAVPFRRGDVDASGVLELTDAVRLLGFLFLGSVEPTCADAADADDSGELDLTDAIAILGYLFIGNAAPPMPGPTACGEDPTEDALAGCAYDPVRC